MNDLNAAFAWVNKLATIQKPLEGSTREARTWEEKLSNPIEGETVSDLEASA